MSIRYIYLDDEDLTEIRSYIRAVQFVADGKLEIERRPPLRYDKQVDALRDLSDEIDGVILDFRLDMRSNEVGGESERANYRAGSIAQEMRSLQAEGKVKEIPLVLWSLSSRFDRDFYPNETSHDLFDLASRKEEINDDAGAKKMASRLISLANGYGELQNTMEENSDRKQFTYKLLGLEESPNFLDKRIITYFDNRSALPIHKYARFILRKMLGHTRPLVDESVLAARLGVDKQQSGDWEELLAYLESSKYKGPFREGWPRWWWSWVSDWWKNEVTDKSLKRLSAEVRVDHLSESLNLDGLVAAQPIEEKYSTRFWTVCEYYGGPLDPTDGLRAQARNLEPWMDRPYISKKAALKRKGEVDPLDDGRFQRLKRRS